MSSPLPFYQLCCMTRPTELVVSRKKKSYPIYYKWHLSYFPFNSLVRQFFYFLFYIFLNPYIFAIELVFILINENVTYLARLGVV